MCINLRSMGGAAAHGTRLNVYLLRVAINLASQQTNKTYWCNRLTVLSKAYAHVAYPCWGRTMKITAKYNQNLLDSQCNRLFQ